MMRTLWRVMAGCAVLWGLASPAVAADDQTPATTHAASVDEQLKVLRQAIREQQQEINALRQKAGVAEGDADALQKQREMIVSMIKQETAQMTSNWGWVSNWSLKGDLRYRHEWINDGTADRDRTRHRLRVRLGLFGKVNDEWSAGLQLATNEGGDPVSTNQTLTNWFDKKAVWWDLMYFEYKPKAVPGLTVTGGKMKQPWYTVADLIWDSDLTPEGLAATYEKKLSDTVTLYAAGGGFWVVERGADADTSLWAAQLRGKIDLPQVASGAYLMPGCSYYGYGNLQGQTPRGLLGNQDDPTLAGNNYLSPFQIVNPFIEAGFPVANLPFKVFADLAFNGSARKRADISKSDFGWMVGCSLGNLKNPGDWQVSYNYRSLQPDSAIGQFADSDFIGGGTNGKGHKVSLGYQAAKNVQLAATYFCNEQDNFVKGGSGSFYHRLQVDLLLKF